MTRRGKIARLPFALRQMLNKRLDNGVKGETLLAWLNGLPEVQAILQQEFRGAPINHANLSAWRQGGYAAWLEEQEIADAARQLQAVAVEVGRGADEATLSKGLSAMLAVELARSAQLLLRQSTDEVERWHRLQDIAKHVNAARREDHRAGWLELENRKTRAQNLSDPGFGAIP